MTNSLYTASYHQLRICWKLYSCCDYSLAVICTIHRGKLK